MRWPSSLAFSPEALVRLVEGLLLGRSQGTRAEGCMGEVSVSGGVMPLLFSTNLGCLPLSWQRALP